MPVTGSNDEADKARRFREAALPYLDDVYTLARYLLRDPTDAEDAVQECFLRALKHFHTYRGPAIKPWLFAILPFSPGRAHPLAHHARGCSAAPVPGR